MAHYPEVSALDYSVQFKGGQIVQNRVYVPEYAYQHSANFDHYPPTDHDFNAHPEAGPGFMALRSTLAASYWESLSMKMKYILAAAHGWDGTITTNPLPTTIPTSKLAEIKMIAPQFPSLQLLETNYLAYPGKQSDIKELVEAWQALSLGLSAWIGQAQLNSASVENCSWVWPRSPFSVYPAVKDEDLEYPDPLNSIPAAHSPTPSTRSETDSLFSESLESVPTTVKSLATQVESPSLKRARMTSPDHTTDEVPNHLQVVVHQPTPIQKWERERELREERERALGNQTPTPPTPASTPVHSNTLFIDTSNYCVDRPVRPLPLRATNAFNRRPAVFEYEFRSEWSRGRFEY